jgi:lipid-binding SYLF domain-containing protein
MMIRKGEMFVKYIRYAILVTMVVVSAVILAGPTYAEASSAKQITRDGKKALKALLAKSVKARALADDAKAILVFPSITKAGFIVGGLYGEGVLLRSGEPVGYFNNVAASFGLQAGVQTYGYALFFMTDAAVKYLDKSDGWELGTAPTIVVVDMGASGGISTTSAQSDMFAFFFNQKGLMAGLGLQGTKVTRIHPK